MMSMNLTDEMMAPAEAVVINYDVLVEHDAIDLAWDAVKAALPLIEKAVREQIARELHDWAALHAGPDGAFFADLWERRIARGDA